MSEREELEVMSDICEMESTGQWPEMLAHLTALHRVRDQTLTLDCVRIYMAASNLLPLTLLQGAEYRKVVRTLMEM